MSTTTNTPADQDPQIPDPAGPPTAEGDQEGTADSGNREAAARRRQLRDTEAERDDLRTQNVALTERVEALQRRQVEAWAADVLEQPEDLWAFGTDLAELLDEHGEVDQDAAHAAVAALAMSRPATRRGAVIPKVSAAASGYGYTGARPTAASWSRVLSER